MISASSVVDVLTTNETSNIEGVDQENGRALDAVRAKHTISDIINREKATEALPGNWRLKFDLTYGRSDTLTEIAIIHHPSQLAEYHIEPTNVYKPLEETHVSVKHANSNEEHLTTASKFKKGCKAVLQHMDQLEQRAQKPTEAQWNSASPDGTSKPDPTPPSASI